MTGRSFSGREFWLERERCAADTGPTNLSVLLKKEDIEFEREGESEGERGAGITPGSDSMDYESRLLSRTLMQSIEIINAQFRPQF